MNTKAAVEPSAWDTVKLAISLAILVASLVAFYYYADVSKLYRVLGIVAAFGIAIAITLQTDKGRQISGFVREAQIEVRKVVWPTRKETTQTTLIVMIVVIIFGALLWLLDLILAKSIQGLIG